MCSVSVIPMQKEEIIYGYPKFPLLAHFKIPIPFWKNISNPTLFEDKSTLPFSMRPFKLPFKNIPNPTLLGSTFPLPLPHTPHSINYSLVLLQYNVHQLKTFQ